MHYFKTFFLRISTYVVVTVTELDIVKELLILLTHPIQFYGHLKSFTISDATRCFRKDYKDFLYRLVQFKMEGSSTSSSELSPATYDFHSVDSWAVSYPPPPLSRVEVRLVFQDVLKSLRAKEALISQPFGEKLDPRFNWQIYLRPRRGTAGRNYISVMLQAISKEDEKNENCTTAVTACFQIQMLDAGGNVYRNIGGKNSVPCNFLKNRSWGSHIFCPVENLILYHKNLLPDGKMILICKIWPTICSRTGMGGAYWRTKRFVDHPSFLQAAENLKLLRKGILSDFKILVVDSNLECRTIPVHRAVLAARSPVFSAMVSNTVLESQLGEVRIEDFDFEVVTAMLEFMYTDSISKQIVAERPADLFRIADKYLVDDLREICEAAVAKCVTVDNAMEIFYFADLYNCLCLKKEVAQFIKIHKIKVQVTSGFKKVSEDYPKLIVDLYFLTELD